MKHGRRVGELERRLPRHLAGNFAMGATLGACLAFSLLLANAHGLSSAINGSEAPGIVRVVFVVGLAAYLGFGAALTAFLMLVSDD
jgi:hypothetical protein